jgi:Mrp family chromosome partitioning ATPase
MPERVSASLLETVRNVTIDGDGDSRLVFVTDPYGLAAEQYKILARMLMNAHPHGGTILITSPGPSEGKTLTSINLSWALAAAGHHTCLVDVSLRAPALARILGVSLPSVAPRLDDDTSRVLKAVCRVNNSSLHVLAGFPRDRGSVRSCDPEVIAPVIEGLRPNFHWRILDCASAMPTADVPNLLPLVDGALLVIRSGVTSKKLIAPCIDMIDAKLWGVVMNDLPVAGSEKASR